MKTKNLCIIPARGGSKRIPRKNIKVFKGKPIIAYSIEKALVSGLFKEVMVSTEDEEIAEIARRFGASVPFFRSTETAGDLATTMDVLEEVTKRYEEQQQIFDLICCIYPTAPLLTIEQLKKGHRQLLQGDFDVVLPVVPFSYPVWRGLKRAEDGKTSMYWPENLNKRSQDLPVVFHDAGQWYWMKKATIGKPMFGEKVGSFVLKAEDVHDIDNNSDWHLAELKYEYLQRFK